METDHLYNLLPEIYRQRDLAQGEPLRALLAILEQQYRAVEADISGLYNNWFIETCEPWVVPYLGDLLGILSLNSELSNAFNQRAYVANAIHYRRRKGVPAILEQVVHDITGWYAQAVEYYHQLSSTQNLFQPHLERGLTVNIRERTALERLGGPNETIAFRPDVRRISHTGRWHNLGEVGLFVRRWQAFPIKGGVANKKDGCYTFHPLGLDSPLFHYPQPKASLEERTLQRHVPHRIRSEALQADLIRYLFWPKPEIHLATPDPADTLKAITYVARQTVLEILLTVDNQKIVTAAQTAALNLIEAATTAANKAAATPTEIITATQKQLETITQPEAKLFKRNLQQALALADSGEPIYFGQGAAIEIFIQEKKLPLDAIFVADLPDTTIAKLKKAIPKLKKVLFPRGQPAGEPTYQVILDPERGRLAFISDKQPATEVKANYAYGFSAPLGGGPYNRDSTLSQPASNIWFATIPSATSTLVDQSNLAEAIQAWVQSPYKNGLIRFTDNKTYEIGALTLTLPGDRRLTLEAADGTRPCLKGTLTIQGSGSQAALSLNGLIISGGIELDYKGSLTLEAQHCTLMPKGITGVGKLGDDRPIQVAIRHSIVGPLYLPAITNSLIVEDSIIDALYPSKVIETTEPFPIAIGATPNQTAYGPPTILARVTILGRVYVQKLEMASEVIFTGPVYVEQRQTGGVRFSYFAAQAETPLRYHCRSAPGIEQTEVQQADKPPTPGEMARLQALLKALFVSIAYGQPGYAQLSQTCPPEIATGAENGAEMGAFQGLLQPQRAAQLKAILDEYLPAGLDVGIFYYED